MLCSAFKKCRLKSKKEGRDQESIQSSTTPDPDTNGKMTTSQLDVTNESQEVSPFPAGDHKASINMRARKHNKNKTEIATLECELADLVSFKMSWYINFKGERVY